MIGLICIHKLSIAHNKLYYNINIRNLSVEFIRDCWAINIYFACMTWIISKYLMNIGWQIGGKRWCG